MGNSWGVQQPGEADDDAKQLGTRIPPYTSIGKGYPPGLVGAATAWTSRELRYLPIRTLGGVHGRRSWPEIMSPRMYSGHSYTLSTSDSFSDEIFALDGSGAKHDLYSISPSASTATVLETFGDRPVLGMPGPAVVYQNYLIVWGSRELARPSKFDHRLYILDRSTREWFIVPKSQDAEPVGRQEYSMVVCEAKLILFGGSRIDNRYNDTWEMSLEPLQSSTFRPKFWRPTWHEWTRPGTTPPARCGHACASYRKKVYLFGGGNRHRLKDLWVGDLLDQSWHQLAVAPWDVHTPCAMVVQNAIYIHGWTFDGPITICFRFPDRTWYRLDMTPNMMPMSQLKSCQTPSRLGFLDGSVFHVLDDSRIEYPAVDISLSEEDVRLQLVDLLKPSPVNTNGGTCDLFLGFYHPTGLKLAMKRPRGIEGQEGIVKRLRKEAKVWSALKHPNILPFLGALNIDDHLHLVSPWIELGDLSSFVRKRSQYAKDRRAYPTADNELAQILNLYHRFNEIRIVHEIAAGIQYLHSIDMVHGDLKGPNILISDSGTPLICDFGLTKVAGTATSIDIKGHGSLRWQSPELFDSCPKSSKSDVYAFAMVIVEIVTGEHPYPKVEGIYAILRKVTSGDGPRREPLERCGVRFEGLWELAARCWAVNPDDRPSMDHVLSLLSA